MRSRCAGNWRARCRAPRVSPSFAAGTQAPLSPHQQAAVTPTTIAAIVQPANIPRCCANPAVFE